MTIKALKINSYLVGILFSIALACKIFLITTPNDLALFTYMFCPLLAAIITSIYGGNTLIEAISEIIETLIVDSRKRLQSKTKEKNVLKQLKTKVMSIAIPIYLKLMRIDNDYFNREQNNHLLKIYGMIDKFAPMIISKDEILIFKKHIEAFYYRKSKFIPTINTEEIELGNISSLGWGIYDILNIRQRPPIAKLMGNIFNRSETNIATMNKKLLDDEYQGIIKRSDIEAFRKVQESSKKFSNRSF